MRSVYILYIIIWIINENLYCFRRKRAGITPITFDASSPPKKPSNERKTHLEYYLPPGKRADASNGNLEGKSMPTKYNRGGNNRGFRGRRGRGRSRGNNRGWRW